MSKCKCESINETDFPSYSNERGVLSDIGDSMSLSLTYVKKIKEFLETIS
tara:strand:- start:8384 stop:8533 length:150 start_codon:yes stop_codon:yes gene_type:complete